MHVKMLLQADRKICAGRAGRGSWGLEKMNVRLNKLKIDNGGGRPTCEEERFHTPTGHGLLLA